MDQISIDRIKTLHPIVREDAMKILSEAEKILTGKASLRFAYTLRSFKEQEELYALGRTKPGSIVTNAKPGKSWHNYGLAFDIVLLVKDNQGKISASWDMKTDFNGNKIPDWVDIVNLCKSKGWSWGGDWKSFKDYPHFEKTFGLSLTNALDRYNKKDFIQNTNYIRI